MKPGDILRRVGSSALLAPLPVATFPVVYLWASNLRNQILIADVVVVLVVVWIVTVGIYAATRFVLHPHRAGMLTVLLVVLTFSFGHIVRLAPAHAGTPGMYALFLGYLLLAGAGVIIASKARISERFISALAFIAAGLVVFNLMVIATSGTPVSLDGLPRAGSTIRFERRGSTNADMRDVYYLIFDRYANDDVLRSEYGFDNRGFLDELEQRGFTVVDDAVANYPGTTHSLASSLNMAYLDDLALEVGPDSDDWRPLLGSLTGTVVQRGFEELEYRTIHIGSWWGPTFSDGSADVNYVYRDIREFPAAFLYTTIVPYAADLLGLRHLPSASEDQFHRIRFQMDAIGRVSDDPRPTFTFAHFTLPHHPYVVDAEGRFVDWGAELDVEEAYVEQLRYTNIVIADIVDGLLQGPETRDPIIVLQSDEGPHPVEVDTSPDPMIDWSREPQRELERKMKIFMAYHFPGRDSRALKPTRTPVNTFRALFGRYFGIDLPLLNDRAYIYAPHDRPYRFDEVSDRLGLSG